MRKFVIIFALLALASVAFGQNTEERSLRAFERITVGQAISVELEKGNSEKAVVEVRGVDLDDVITEVRGSTLRIKMAEGRYRNLDVRVRVTYKELSSVSVSSAADLYSRGIITADRFDIDVSSAGGVELQVDAQKMEIEASSSGHAEVSGKAGDVEISASSAGSIRAFDLEADEVYARANSAGSVKITAKRSIDARASSGGSIRYRGNPDKEYTGSSSGGSVRRY